MKKLILSIIIFSLVFSLVSCKNNEEEQDYSDVESPVVTMEFEKFGTVEIELYPDLAPNTVENFIYLIEKGFYDGLTIHRVAPTFVIQGGDPEGTGRGGPGYKIKGEFKDNGFKRNTIRHTQGVISMARAAKPYDSAGSQFFIMLGDDDSLDGQYAAFGRVIKGLDIVLDIGLVEVNNNQRPKEEIVIKKVTVDTKGVTYAEPQKIK